MKGYAGESPLLELELSEEGEFLNGQIHSYRQTYDHLGLKPDSKNGAVFSIKKLSEEDFSNSLLNIDDSGRINYPDNSK